MNRTRSADPRFVRQWNEYIVLDVLRNSHAPMRISELATTTGLTAASLGQVLKSLQTKGWVTSTECDRPRRGRPAQAYFPRTQPGWVLGIDISPLGGRAVRMDLDGEIRARCEVIWDTPDAPREQLAKSLIDDVLADAGGQPVLLSGIACMRRSNADGFDPAWGGERHAHEIVADLLPGASQVYPHVQAATWAERAKGAARDEEHVLLVHLGHQPTLGLLIDGEFHHGARGDAGGLPLSRIFDRDIIDDSSGPFDGMTVDEICDVIQKAIDGEPSKKAHVQSYTRSIVSAVVFAASIIDPSVIVLAGPLSKAAHVGIPELEEELARESSDPPRIVVSELSHFAGAIGAAQLSLESIVNQHVSPTRGVEPLTVVAPIA